MPTTYSVAEPSVVGLVNRVMRECHDDLHNVEPTIEVLIASPAIFSNGISIGSKTKIMSLQDRMAGSADLRIILSKYVWDNASETEQSALIDAALACVEPAFDKLNSPKTDDADRPVLRKVPKDYHLEGHWSAIKRRREQLLDVQRFASIRREFERMEIEWTAAELMAAGNAGVESEAE